MRGVEAALALGCLVLLDSLPDAECRQERQAESDGRSNQRLAVLLPTFFDRENMQEGRWPPRCSPGKMAGNIDLVLYESDLENVDSTDPPPEADSGCFARVRTIYGGQVGTTYIASWSRKDHCVLGTYVLMSRGRRLWCCSWKWLWRQQICHRGKQKPLD